VLERCGVFDAKENLLQPRRVDVLGCDRQLMTVITTFHQRRHRPIGTRERLTQPRDVTDQAPLGARRLLVTPRRVEESINGGHRARPDEKRAKDPARGQAPDRHRPIRAVDLQRAKDRNNTRSPYGCRPPAVTHLRAVHS
jgi:hypothetical protein